MSKHQQNFLNHCIMIHSSICPSICSVCCKHLPKYENICCFGASEHNIILSMSTVKLLKPKKKRSHLLGTHIISNQHALDSNHIAKVAEKKIQRDQMHLYFHWSGRFCGWCTLFRRKQDVCCSTLCLGWMNWALGSHEGIECWITALYRPSVNV